jgi:hypothetical protein
MILFKVEKQQCVPGIPVLGRLQWEDLELGLRSETLCQERKTVVI